MPSFDIVSEVNMEEVRNATENASRELSTRFDFRNANASFEFKNPNVTVKAEGDFQIKQMLDMLRAQLAKRQIDAKAMSVGNMDHTGKTYTQHISFKVGVNKPLLKSWLS